jgi:hypothetical protein
MNTSAFLIPLDTNVLTAQLIVKCSVANTLTYSLGLDSNANIAPHQKVACDHVTPKVIEVPRLGYNGWYLVAVNP